MESKSLKTIRNVAIVVALMAVTALVSYRLGAAANGEGERLDLGLMWQVKDRLEEKYIDKDKLDDQKMVYGSIKGLVESLDDPYTFFLSPEENKISEENLAGEFGGVGISLGFKEKTLAVMSPLPGTPADEAGIEAGDLILRIVDEENGVDRDTAGINLEEAVQIIRGKVGTEVTLNLFREGEEPFDVTLKRDNIVVPSLETEWVEEDDKRILWVKLYKFSEQLYQDWDKVVTDARQSDGMVLDLRGNPGGFLQASVMVASDFLEEGVVVKQENWNGSVDEYRVEKNKSRLKQLPLVVLIDGGSASASEILAGALRDYNRTKLVGEKTFGKGTVQQPEEFRGGSGLHVTIARWLLPDGKNIHKEGVEPDVEVLDNPETEEDEQLLKAVETIN